MWTNRNNRRCLVKNQKHSCINKDQITVYAYSSRLRNQIQIESFCWEWVFKQFYRFIPKRYTRNIKRNAVKRNKYEVFIFRKKRYHFFPYVINCCEPISAIGFLTRIMCCALVESYLKTIELWQRTLVAKRELRLAGVSIKSSGELKTVAIYFIIYIFKLSNCVRFLSVLCVRLVLQQHHRNSEVCFWRNW